MAHQVRVGDEHARRFGDGAEDADRLARLHHQGFIVIQRTERAHDGVEAIPTARGAARAAVDDELIGVLGNLGIEIVVDHAQGGFLMPALAGDFTAAGRADGGRSGHSRQSYRRATIRRHASSFPEHTCGSTPHKERSWIESAQRLQPA